MEGSAGGGHVEEVPWRGTCVGSHMEVRLRIPIEGVN